MKAGPKAEDEEQLGETHTVTPAYVGVAGGSGTPGGGLPAAAGAPAPGDVISGKYRIEECLGKGGMGMVFRATHLLSEKRVALKWMMRPLTDAQTTGRFVREARAAARIDHANVVDLYDVGEHEGFGYLVMELLRGESLWERLGRGTLDVTTAVDLVLPAMRGVAAAHAAGVIHRDLKPHNVFLCVGPDGSAREAKVLDFGISSFTNADAADPTLTQEGTILGTPAYMSPEQLRSSVRLDPRTDVYSMGVILYEAVTGRVPFEEPSFTSLVLAIASSEPAAPRSLRPELSVELEQVIVRAIARDREQRYPDMASFIAALEPHGSQLRLSGPRTEPGLGKPRIDLTPSMALAPTRTLDLAPEARATLSSQEPVPPVAVAPRRRTAAPRGRRWPGLLAIALIASVLGWWFFHGARRDAEPGDAPVAGGVEATRAAAGGLEQSPAVAEPGSGAGGAGSVAGAAVPAAAAMPGADVAAPAAGAPGAPVVIAAPVGSAPMEAAAEGDAARPKAARRKKTRATPAAGTAPAAGTEPAPRPPAGRSGTLSLDDML